MSIAESLLPEFDAEMAKTRRMLERLPVAHCAWRPHEKSRCLGELVEHLVRIPEWLPLMMSADETDFASVPQPAYAAPASAAALLARFDAHLAAGRALLAAATDARMLGHWTGRAGERVFFSQPRTVLLRSFFLSHMIHHRGQLTVYYRMLGVPLPALFGPTADEGGA